MTPSEAIENEMKWSQEYSALSDEYGNLEVKKAEFLQSNIETLKTVRSCEIKWNATMEGSRMILIYRKLKSLEKEISSMKTYLKHAENEAKNVY